MSILNAISYFVSDMTPGSYLVRMATGQTQPVAVPLGLMVAVEESLKENGFEALHSYVLVEDDLFCFEISTAHWPFVRSLLQLEFGLVYR